LQRWQVTEQVANIGLAAVIHRHDQESRRRGERRKHGLGRGVTRGPGIGQA
jgi:hypothetical protein